MLRNNCDVTWFFNWSHLINRKNCHRSVKTRVQAQDCLSLSFFWSSFCYNGANSIIFSLISTTIFILERVVETCKCTKSVFWQKSSPRQNFKTIKTHKRQWPWLLINLSWNSLEIHTIFTWFSVKSLLKLVHCKFNDSTCRKTKTNLTNRT